MEEKRNDYFLNLLTNPTFSASDFILVGLSVDNTSLQDKDVYSNSNYIRDLDIFKTNELFDLSKLDNFYKYAKLGFLDLAKIKETDDLGKTWMAYRNDISAPESLRDNSPQFRIKKVMNPLRLLEGFVTFGLREDPTLSIREIAQTLQVWDVETNSWKDSPNETWFDNFLNPKVLATWDFDADENGNPTSDPNKIIHHKGDRKLNANGTYYYETLGNRSIYGKEVLSGFDTLTTDGSFMNKLDFLDSDDIEKSGKGAFMRAAALIVPAFIPGVNTWYIAARVGLGLTQIFPTVGKMLLGISGEEGPSILSKIEAWDKALSFSLSDYVQGSQADDGLILLDSHLWSLETAFKLVADVFTLLAELRWLFEKTTSLLSGLSKDVIINKNAQNKWIEDYIAKNSKNPTLEEVLKGLEKGEEAFIARQNIQRGVEWARAQQELLKKLKGAQELGSKISMAYMTGITTASSFGEMKRLGATDLEAALFTLGYSLAEFGLLNTQMGKWILPELKLERTHMKNVVAKSMEKIKESSNEIALKSDIKKAKAYSKLINLGRNAYYNNLGQGIGNEVAGTIVSNMGAEALEETSEELLLDLAKVFYNEASSLVGGDFKFNDAFKDVFDRYALSFIGGALGGGIAGVQAGTYRQARYDRNMTLEQASKELVDYILLGKGQELINTVNKMTFSNKYMDEFGNETDDYTKSLDFQVKSNFARLVNDIQDILTVNGADMNTDQLMGVLTPKDIRFGMLASIAERESNSVMYYLNRYNELSTDLVKASLELKNLEPKSDSLKNREEQKEENKGKVKELLDKIKNIKEELDKFKDGTESINFMLDSMFEMTSKISKIYLNNFELYAEDKYNKSIDELTDDQLAIAKKEFDELKPLTRDLIRKGRLVHIQNMEWLAKMMDEYNEKYFKDENEAIINLNGILFGNRNVVNNHPNESVPRVQSYFAIEPGEINEFLKLFLVAILESLDETEMKPFMDRLKDIDTAYRPFLIRNGIKETLDSFEKIESLPEELRTKIFLLFDVNNIDELKEDFAKEVEGNKVLDVDSFNKVIEREDVDNRREQTEEFKIQLINFLMDPKVKDAIIKKLSSAKYMLPSIKVALDLFFDSKLSYTDKSGELNDDGTEPEIGLNKKIIEEYKNSYKDLPSSPVDIYLKNIHRTLKSKGIDLAPSITDLDNLIITLSRAKDLESFSYDENIERQINDALKIIQFAKVGLESAATKIDVDLSDAYGFNAAVNQLLEKRKGEKKHLKLAEIRADIATGIILDIERYEQTLLYYKNLFNYNSNAILNEHDKTYKVLSKNLYDKLKGFVKSVEVPEWDELDKLREALEDSDLVEVMDSIKDKKAPNTDEFKKKLTSVRQKLDRAVHNFLIKNSSKSVKDLIKGLTVSFAPGRDSYTVLNASEESLNDKDLLWYLASMSAVDPDILMNEYLSVINANFAPVIGLEEAIKKILSYLVNPREFNRFADAWNELVMERYGEEMKSATVDDQKNTATLKAASTLVNVKRAIFVEGLPGSGKSSAVLNTVIDTLRKHHPEKLKNVVIVSNSKDNAKTLTENLGFESDKTQYFGIDEFRNKVMNNYEAPVILKDGQFLYKEGDTYHDNNRKMRRYAKATLNPDGLDATFLIIDEATSLSLMDAAMFDDWMEAKSIYGVYAGDFDLLGTSGLVTTDTKLLVSISLGPLNYISTHKLGLVIRGNNTYKSNDIISLKINKYNFINSLLQHGKISPINFTYYIDDSGLYGDIVVRPDLVVTSSGTTLNLDENTKNAIDKMISSLGEGEKLNYIFDSPNTLMYKYLDENYKDKINKVSTNASLSQEGKYYIVDISLSENLDDIKDRKRSLVTAERLFNILYTAISRAKLGTIIYDENGVISRRINSQRANKLVKTEMAKDSKKNYAIQRQNAIISVIPEGTPEKFEKLLWNNEEVKTTEEPLEEVHNEEEEDNLPYIPDIKNVNDGELNMLIHTFNCHELGGVVDENGLLVLGEHHRERVDNAHGLVKLLGLTVTDGKLSVEDTQKIIKAIDEIRAIGTYGESNDIITANITTTLNNIFGKNYRDQVEVRFIYKNSFEPDTLVSKNKLLKFFKSAKEKIRYLFSKETDKAKRDKLETPSDHTIGLEIYVKGKQIDIPIGVLTNPATIINSDGFQLLKDIYDDVRGDSNLGNFTSELKRRKLAGENIPHLNEMLLLLELYLWRYNHPSKKNLAVRLNKDFVLNLGRITGILIPPTGILNPTGARGYDYLDMDYYYPGRPVTLEEYRREMPNRNISSVLEGITGDFKYDGKVYIKKGKPFVLMSDYYTDYTDKELYLEYIKQVLENKPRKITLVYVNLPKKQDIGYFLWNLQEALKREGNNTKAKDIDYSVGNKLTSFRLLLFMLKKDSNFLLAYNEFMETIEKDPSFIIDKDSHKRSTLDRISRLLLIMQILTDYENSLKDLQKEVLVSDESGIERKIVETITKKKQFLDFLDLNIEALKTKNNELYKLFIPDGALNPDTDIATIGNTKFTIRTALLFEFRRLLLGGFYLLDGKTVYGLSTPYRPNVQIERDGDTFKFQDFLQGRIDALKKDIESNNWNGILVNTNLVRNSEIAASIGTQSYKVARLQTQDESFVSSESFEFNGKLPTSASIINVAPLINEILDKAIIMDTNGDFETSEQALRFSNEEKKQIYIENMGAYLEGRRPSKVKSRDLDISKPYNTIINSLEVDENTEEVQDIVKKYLLNPKNKYNSDASAEELLKLIFGNVKNFGILKVGSNFKIMKLNLNQLVVIKSKDLSSFYVMDSSKGNNIYLFNEDHNGDLVSLSDLIKLTDLTPEETLVIENYKNKKLLETKFKVGDEVTISISKELQGDHIITNILINPEGNIVYLLDDGNLEILQDVADNNEADFKLKELSNIVQSILDEITGGKVTPKNISLYITDNQSDLRVVDAEGKQRINLVRGILQGIVDTYYEDKNIADKLLDEIDDIQTTTELIELAELTGFGDIKISRQQLLTLFNELAPTINQYYQGKEVGVIDETNCKILI